MQSVAEWIPRGEEQGIGMSKPISHVALSLVTTLATLALAACGGGGGGGGGGSVAPTTYSIIANVSGLSGSNLVLSLGTSTNVNVSGNGAVTLATGLNTGSAFSVSIYTQPINPVQTCTVTGGSGNVSGANANVTVSCIAGTATTVNAALATVTVDPTVPSSVASIIKSIVSPLDSQMPGSTLFVPISLDGGESMVFATDGNNNIILASLLTTTSVTLSANSTALALTRLLMGSLPATASATQVNAAIQATAEYPNLISLVSVALAANTSPATSTAVFASINTVFNQLPASLLATFSQTKHLMARTAAAPVAQPSVTTTQSKILTTSAGGTVIGAVSISGATADGGADASNSTAIAWSLASADTSGNSLCAPSTPKSTNDPDCAVLVDRTELLTNALSALSLGSVSTEEIGGNGAAFNVTLEQNTLSKTANILQSSEDIIQSILGVFSAGTDAPFVSCINSALEAFLPPAEVSSLVLDPSPSAFEGYLKNVVLSPISIAKAYINCPNVNVAQLPAGSNPIGPVSFQSAVIQLIVKAAEFAESEFLNGAVGLGQLAVTTFGIPLEISELNHYWAFSGVVGVCEAPLGQSYQISNCAASFTFSAPVITMVPGTSFVPALQALDINGNPTLTPADLVYSSPQDTEVVDLNLTTGGVVALEPPQGQTSAKAMVTVMETSTGISASYTVNVNSLPTETVGADPTNLPAAGGSVTLTVTLGPPAGAIAGTPTPSGTVTFTDTAGATFCAQPVAIIAGVATCTASLINVPDTITANYTGDSTYAENSGSVTISLLNTIQTSTSLVSSPTFVSAGGGPVTLTATISSSGAPEGTSAPTGAVTFSDSAVTICANVPLASSSAQCQATNVMPGDTITAAYSGDDNYSPSSGTTKIGAVPLTLNPAGSSVTFGLADLGIGGYTQISGPSSESQNCASPCAQFGANGGTYSGTLSVTDVWMYGLPGYPNITTASNLSGSITFTGGTSASMTATNNWAVTSTTGAFDANFGGTFLFTTGSAFTVTATCTSSWVSVASTFCGGNSAASIAINQVGGPQIVPVISTGSAQFTLPAAGQYQLTWQTLGGNGGGCCLTEAGSGATPSGSASVTISLAFQPSG
jgi:Big-like domain-containing protein